MESGVFMEIHGVCMFVVAFRWGQLKKITSAVRDVRAHQQQQETVGGPQ
jgi:hypothetical protein